MLGKRNNNLPNGGETGWFTMVPFCKKVTQLNKSKLWVVLLRSFYSPWKMMMAWPYRRLLTPATTYHRTCILSPTSGSPCGGGLWVANAWRIIKFPSPDGAGTHSGNGELTYHTKREKGNLSTQKSLGYVSSQEAIVYFPTFLGGFLA